MIEWIVSSSLLIAVFALLRRLFRGQISPRLQYGLWALVLIRLLVPFSFFQSMISTDHVVDQFMQQPQIQAITDQLSKPGITFEQAYQQAVKDFQNSGMDSPELPQSNVTTPSQPAVTTPEMTVPPQTVPVTGVTVPVQTLPSQTHPSPEVTVPPVSIPLPDYQSPHYIPQTPLELHTQELLDQSTPAFSLKNLFLIVFWAGFAATGACLVLSNLRFARYLLHHRKAYSTTSDGLQVYTCTGLDTPCLFGLVRPAIYLTPDEASDETRTAHILAHECTHFHHWDHIWSILRCVCLALHWYNPLVWLAAILSRQDAELACDETTIRKIGESERLSYGRTLIEMTCAKHSLSGLLNTATTMTGSMSAIKERVTMIAKKPKMALYTLIVVLLITAIAVGCTFSGSIDSEKTNPTEPAEQEIILPELTLEMKADINFPWFQQFDKFPAWYSEETDDAKKGGIRYYGTYGDHMVFFEPGIMFLDSIEDGKFVSFQMYGQNGTFLIFQDGTATKYQQFDKISGLTEDEMMQVYQIHRKYTQMIWDHDLDTDRTIRFSDDVFGTVEPEKDYYRPLEEVTIKVPLRTDTGFLFLMNKQQLELSSYDREYWYFTFRMPYGSVVVDFKTYDGFIEDEKAQLIEAYFLANQYLDRVSVQHFYGKCESGALVAMMNGREFLDKQWEELISGQSFLYETDNQIQVLYEGKFHTLTNAYQDGILSNTELISIQAQHKEIYSHLYQVIPPQNPIRELSYSECLEYNRFVEAHPYLRFFLSAYFHKPEDFPLFDVLSTLPESTYLNSEDSFRDMVSLDRFPYPDITSLDQMPCRVLVISKSRIENLLLIYLGITLDQLTQSLPRDGSVLYSPKTETYYCLAPNSQAEIPTFDIDAGIIWKDGTVFYYGINKETYETIVISTENKNSAMLYSFRQLHRFEPSHYVYYEDQIKRPSVFYNGMEYGFHSWRGFSPGAGYTLVGTVIHENNNAYPTEEFHASQLPKGTEIYTGMDNGMLSLYALRPDGLFYQLERKIPPKRNSEPEAYYQSLLRDNQWMNLIASLPFETPEEFCHTFLGILCTYNLPNEEPITAEEKAFLESIYGYPIEIAIHRMPCDILHEAVQKYLGVDIYQLPKEDLPTYNAATNCYYTAFNGAEGLFDGFCVTKVETEGTTVTLTLDCSYYVFTVKLKTTNSGYQFLSVSMDSKPIA